MSIDPFLSKRYDKDTYHCLHFTRDVWFGLTGVDITDRLQGLLAPASERKPHRGALRAFKRLRRPVAPCVVYMRQLGQDPHVGVLVDHRLLHMQKHGPEFLPLALAGRGFTDFGFYQ